jgi:CRISPR-associated protein Cas5d
MSSPKRITHVLEVWGDFACFTRPEMKVERFSYPCPTPGASRGAFEAIYFKPQFRWQVMRIELLNPPAYISLRRNEVKDKINFKSNWIKGEDVEPLWADGSGTDDKGRTQRQTMALRSPRFRLFAQIIPRSGQQSEQTGYDEQFARRASQGKCFQQPYFGCREFVAFFRLIDDVASEAKPVDYSQDLGFMVYDTFDLGDDNHAKLSARDDGWKDISSSIAVFPARIERGVLEVPPYESDAVRKPGRRAG